MGLHGTFIVMSAIKRLGNRRTDDMYKSSKKINFVYTTEMKKN